MKLAPELRFLCNKVASERTRPALWKTAAELRKDTERVLASGQTLADARSWLESLLAAALAAQSKT